MYFSLIRLSHQEINLSLYNDHQPGRDDANGFSVLRQKKTPEQDPVLRFIHSGLKLDLRTFRSAPGQHISAGLIFRQTGICRDPDQRLDPFRQFFTHTDNIGGIPIHHNRMERQRRLRDQ